MHDDQFRILLEYLQYSWSGYRKVRKGVKKRIQRHMNQLNCRNMTDYIKLLDLEPVTRHQCELQMTVSISRFFRDRRLWDLLKRSWLPNLIIKNSRVLKVWSAGCACGEEAYSFKIIWEQLGQAFHLLPELELLATDIYPYYLERARGGIYSRSSLKEVASDLQKIYFESRRSGRQYMIKDYLKTGIRWDLHHLSTDPPEKNFGIIFLRNNVLTYYRREAREKVLINILDSLLPGGLFIIGCHEKLPFQPPSLRPMTELSYVFRKC
jgi:chemotaxis methyl-accepting protein methylase